MSSYRSKKKGGITKRFREMVKIVIAENFCGNTDKDGTAYSSKQCKCSICKECWTPLSLIRKKKVFSKIRGEQNSELILFFTYLTLSGYVASVI